MLTEVAIQLKLLLVNAVMQTLYKVIKCLLGGTCLLDIQNVLILLITTYILSCQSMTSTTMN